MPYNIWCGGCGNHIGMGVRYNAEKKKVGNYYTTPIYRFRMKCHLCDNYIEIETDPKNCDYTIISGARRKEERWDPSATENVQATDHAEKQKLIDDAMYKLEHGEKDKRKSKAAIPGLVQIKDIQAQWKDDFALNQMLRKKFRQEKKVILDKEEKDQEIKDKGSLDIDLVNEDPEDIELSKRIRFRSTGFEGDQRKRRLQIKARPMFTENGTSDKNSHRASLLEKRQKIMINKPKSGVNTSCLLQDLGIKRTKDKIRCNKNQETDSGQHHDNPVSVKEINIQPQDSEDICKKEGVLEALETEKPVKNSKDNKTNNEFTNDSRNASPEKGLCKQNISLISDMYSDTDSESSK